jgi:hypothetical protein
MRRQLQARTMVLVLFVGGGEDFQEVKAILPMIGG